MKISMANLQKLERMDEDDIDVQGQVQHWIDTEPELLIDVLGGDVLDQNKRPEWRENMAQPDGWKCVLATVKNATRSQREKKKEKATADILPLANKIRFGDELDAGALRAVFKNNPYSHLCFSVGDDYKGLALSYLRDALKACKGTTLDPPRIVNGAINSIVLNYRGEKNHGTIKLALYPVSHDGRETPLNPATSLFIRTNSGYMDEVAEYIADLRNAISFSLKHRRKHCEPVVETPAAVETSIVKKTRKKKPRREKPIRVPKNSGVPVIAF